jgi:hypothetical protein
MLIYKNGNVRTIDDVLRICTKKFYQHEAQGQQRNKKRTFPISDLQVRQPQITVNKHRDSLHNRRLRNFLPAYLKALAYECNNNRRDFEILKK